MGWLEDDIRAMDTTDAVSQNKEGVDETYTGVLIATLLNMAEPKNDATTLVLVADDGYSVEVPLADVLACTNCILSFRTNGGFSSVLPGFAKNTNVKGIVEIQVK